jgi:hypothetical protein
MRATWVSIVNANLLDECFYTMAIAAHYRFSMSLVAICHFGGVY